MSALGIRFVISHTFVENPYALQPRGLVVLLASILVTFLILQSLVLSKLAFAKPGITLSVLWKVAAIVCVSFNVVALLGDWALAKSYLYSDRSVFERYFVLMGPNFVVIGFFLLGFVLRTPLSMRHEHLEEV